MALSVIAQTKYSGGRGKGVLGTSLISSSRKPGQEEDSTKSSNLEHCDDLCGPIKKLLVMYSYKANPDSPGGFTELSVEKGQLLEYICQHPDNEHWWKARNKDGIVGYVPSTYVILKEDQILPWLEQSQLEAREAERKDRIRRQQQQKDLNGGMGFGLPPKQSDKPYVYISAYNRKPEESEDSTKSTNSYYCDVCEKSFNGPKPYKAHMTSKAHKEELEMQKEYGTDK